MPDLSHCTDNSSSLTTSTDIGEQFVDVSTVLSQVLPIGPSALPDTTTHMGISTRRWQKTFVIRQYGAPQARLLSHCSGCILPFSFAPDSVSLLTCVMDRCAPKGHKDMGITGRGYRQEHRYKCSQVLANGVYKTIKYFWFSSHLEILPLPSPSLALFHLLLVLSFRP
ncbi:hypothetical protein BC826DRAFT_107044 [Russula brevipes]|nr:hypothetical protein BC826DRAFT_107044 [Russula brevipes]